MRTLVPMHVACACFPAFFPAFFLACVLAGPADADGTGLAVLGHDRGAVPARSVIGELLDRLKPDPEEVSSAPPSRQAIDPAAAVRQSGYPVVSGLGSSSGSAGLKKIDVPLPAPVCVIGPDAASLRWLSRNRNRLREMGASCILVRARGPAEVERVRSAARPLPLTRVAVDPLHVLIRIMAGIPAADRMKHTGRLLYHLERLTDMVGKLHRTLQGSAPPSDSGAASGKKAGEKRPATLPFRRLH